MELSFVFAKLIDCSFFLRLLNMLAEAILKHNEMATTSLSEGIFTSYADVRSTSLEEKIKKD